MRTRAYRRLGVTDPLVRHGFEICRNATRRTGEIEYAVIQLLPPAVRIALWAMYGAARTIDDLADADGPTDNSPGLEEWIQAFAADFERCTSDDPVRAALLHTVQAWHLPLAWLSNMFEGQRDAATGRELATWQQWYDYVEIVITPFVMQVASMLAQNAGLSVALSYGDGTIDMWLNLARAFHLTDTLADLGEDGARGRIRLPLETMDQFGVRRDDLLNGHISPALCCLVRHLTDTARQWLDASPGLPRILHPALGITLECHIGLYRLLLDTIDMRLNAARLPPRVTLRPREVWKLLLPARAQATVAWALFPFRLDLFLAATPDDRDRPRTIGAPTLHSVDAPRSPQHRPNGLTSAQARQAEFPTHVAIILDGNGRWAIQRRLPRNEGHRAGMEALKEVVEGALEMGLRYLTVYVFSTENWKRPTEETGTLLHVIPRELLHYVRIWQQQNVRIRWAGQRAGLPLDTISALTTMVTQTSHNTGLTLTLCLNYGGRAEITTAASRLAADALAGRIDPTTVTEPQFTNYLHVPELPDVDILLRTGAEQRTSNFLPWQATYAELIFIDTYWPDFTRHDLQRAIDCYRHRRRRFGAAEMAGDTVDPTTHSGGG
ncbi:polyprenyl diphosphate synthase [Nocardia arthritidis]|uniref:Isoprenyl transferase n=1 Tax=Nocardia arthritidis TaxID=228602 RepID=A0A6G9YK85_9NOCA|nr:polyprenyl diphosphate synthase [Nocardia arthritidis]QIS13601.1 di-trans,poly-cis-decaprenylcistransferase [Nocardia arthritidis]